MLRRLWMLLIATIITIGVCGCMKTDNNHVRTENDQQYAELMLQYMTEKYCTDFEIVEYIFPKSGFNSGMKENILVVKDSEGVLANARARLGAPYDYYDNYVNSWGADQIQRSINLSNLLALGNARLYAVVKSNSISEIDIAPEGVTSVTLVVNIPQNVSEDAMEQLYDVYCQVCDAGYQKFYLIAWFTDGSPEFDQAVENYRVYGKSDWTHYSGTVYTALKVTTPNLSYDDFRNTLIEN